jgi:hypothetical protein
MNKSRELMYNMKVIFKNILCSGFLLTVDFRYTHTHIEQL